MEGGYYQDPGKRNDTPERRAELEMEFEAVEMSAQDRKAIVEIRMGILNPDTLPDDKLRQFIVCRSRAWGEDEGFYPLDTLPHEDLALLAGSDFPNDGAVEEIRKKKADRYMNITGTDPVIYAQYTSRKKRFSHATCIVGWDDTFPASAFREGNQPPANGARICRNSSGEK